MPTIDPPRHNKDGSTTHRVRWRESPVYRPTVGFNTTALGPRALILAERFASLVEAAGERWPTREQLAPFNLEWVLGPAIDNAPTSSASPSGIVTVAEATRRYLDWLRHSANPPNALSLKEYEGHLRRDIECRAIGAMDVATVQFEDIDNWQRELLTTVGPFGRKPLSPDSVRNKRQALLAPAFTFACSVRSGRPPLRALSSPMDDSELPDPGPAFQRQILETPDEYAMFIRIAYEVDKNWARMAATVATTGMRFGEGVQLGPTSVVARRHLLRITERISGGNVETGRKNGDAGTVPVPEWVTSRILAPALDRGGPYLFVGPTGNRWSYPTEWNRWDAVRKRLAAEGLHIHLTHHCLRKGYRTWLATKGIAETKIDLVMGHRTQGIRARYTDLTATDRDQIRHVVTQLVPEHAWPGR